MKRRYDDVLVYTGIRWLPISELLYLNTPVNLLCYNSQKDETKIVKVTVTKENDSHSHMEKVHHLTLSTNDEVDLLDEPYLLYVNHQTRERTEVPDVNENSVRVFTFEVNNLIMRSEARTRKVMKLEDKEVIKETYIVDVEDNYYLLTKASEDSIPVFK